MPDGSHGPAERESALIASALIQHAAAQGIETQLLTPEGSTLGNFQEPMGVVPLGLVEHIAETLARTVGNEHVGLHLERYPLSSDFGILGYYSASAVDCRTFMTAAYQFLAHVTDVFRFEVGFGPRFGYFALCPTVHLERVRHSVELQLACFLRNVQQSVDPNFEPWEVHLAHGPSDGGRAYRDLFQCKVLFNQSRYEIRFDPRLGEQPGLYSDPKLRAALEPYVEDAVQRLRVRTAIQFSMRVQTLILEQLRGQTPSLEDVADSMKIRPRTLQFRLAREGTTFRDLLDQARCFAAISAIIQGADATQVASDLGYEESASFYRAFRRWTGTTPAVLRTSGAPWRNVPT